VAQQWSQFLDGEAARAKTPSERTVYDPHRLSAYIELHQPERAIPMLQQSEKDFPDDYNPPARLAIAYKEMKQWDRALAASDRAFARVYGPRQFTLWRVRVDILLGKGDQAAARDAVTKAIAAAEAMPDGQRSEATIASFKKRLAAMDTPPAAH
jgi:tetratricopeptide (TPR) repeat protein